MDILEKACKEGIYYSANGQSQLADIVGAANVFITRNQTGYSLIIQYRNKLIRLLPDDHGRTWWLLNELWLPAIGEEVIDNMGNKGSITKIEMIVDSSQSLGEILRVPTITYEDGTTERMMPHRSYDDFYKIGNYLFPANVDADVIKLYIARCQKSLDNYNNLLALLEKHGDNRTC